MTSMYSSQVFNRSSIAIDQEQSGEGGERRSGTELKHDQSSLMIEEDEKLQVNDDSVLIEDDDELGSKAIIVNEVEENDDLNLYETPHKASPLLVDQSQQ